MWIEPESKAIQWDYTEREIQLEGLNSEPSLLALHRSKGSDPDTGNAWE